MKNVKWGGIILVIFFIILGLGLITAYNMIPAEPNNNYNTYNEVSIIEEEIEEEIDIEEINLSETDIEMDIKDEKDVLVDVLPIEADITELKFNSTNPEIAKFKKSTEKSTKTIVYGAIEPIAEGECKIYVESNGIESNKVKIKIIDNERIEREKREAEEQARKEAEEKARREAEEQAKREAEEQARKQAEEQARKEAERVAAQKAAQEQAKKQQQAQAQTQKPATTTSTPQTTNSRTVYVTPTGKRYHYSPTCGGKNSTASTLSNAQARGLTPCKKCAQ